jgi:UDP-N-acetylmuramoyl-L-alanyl-D-glutamate--2,6-diaminopimelate ligase
VPTLQHILSNITVQKLQGNFLCEVETVCIDSRKVVPGSCFVALLGTQQDAHQYIQEVVAKGAKSIICSTMPLALAEDVCYVLVEDTNAVLGLIAANFYQHPSKDMYVVGITGTNGKTTTATLAYQLFTKLGYQCGLLSTVQNIVGTQATPSALTTPDAITVQAMLHQMRAAGCSHVFMEVSSHAVAQHRINGVEFSVAVFSNISHDHLDYHGTFDHYIAAKKKFFDELPKTAFAITNVDDKRGAVMLQNTKAKKRSYGIKNIADYKAKVLENTIEGLHLTINGTALHCSMIGEFNAYNLLALYAIADCLQLANDEILPAISMLKGAVGRFEVMRTKETNILGIVDYAHTPDALINVLATINKMRTGNEAVHTVIGCGGDRDRTKRPVMAQVACEHSSKVIFTSDNPRTEDPEAILNDMIAGVPAHLQKRYVKITDRREAIRTACMLAQSGDIVLVAGKGHENYQEINGVRTHFDDKEILLETFNALQL